MDKVLGKRQRESIEVTTDPKLPPHLQKREVPSICTTLSSVETIDLTMSSPIAPENDSMVVEDEPFYVSSNAVSGSSSPVEYGSEDEEEVSYYKVKLNLQLLKLFP